MDIIINKNSIQELALTNKFHGVSELYANKYQGHRKLLAVTKYNPKINVMT